MLEDFFSAASVSFLKLQPRSSSKWRAGKSFGPGAQEAAVIFQGEIPRERRCQDVPRISYR